MNESTDPSTHDIPKWAVFVGNDLMFQSKISSACQVAGLSLKVLRNPQASISETLGQIEPAIFIVDLGLANLDLGQFLMSGKERYPGSLWLGFGAHVLAERLEEASQLGFDLVVTRGQFDRDMNRILQSIPRG